MSATSAKWMRIRLYMVAAVFAVALVAVWVKAFYIQVHQREELTERANQEITRYLNLGSVRGEIFDANGERLAASLAVASVYVDPVDIADKGEASRLLAEALGLDFESVAKSISSKGRFKWLKRQVPDHEAEAVKKLGLKGVGISKEYRRAYPNNGMAAHLLGFVGIDGQGLEGLELTMDENLKAGAERLKVKRDNLGRIMLNKTGSDVSQPRGSSVILTLDRRIQYITEKALATAVTTYKAKSGMALVMRPKTGAVLAAAVWPTFDPNDYKATPDSSHRNRILTDTFEPGSTFKVFVVASALEEKRITPDSVIHCENGAFRVANHTVKDTRSYGDLTVSQIIKFSSNIGSLKIGDILGTERLYNYLTRFSFGEKTGLSHLAGEASGLLRPPKQWHKLDAANIAFGQGLSVTTLQMVMAMSSLANDGVLMRPYIVERVVDSEGKTIMQHEPEIIRQVVSPLTARQVAAMLRMAVMPGGTATRAEVPGYPVAGKTGTAQKVVRGGKTYAAGKYVASFLGFAPYHDPQLCVMVVLDEPGNGYYGGHVATPAFKEIMENALPLLDIPPTEDKGDPVWPLLMQNTRGAPGVVADDQPTNFIRVKLKKGDRGAKGAIKLDLPIENPVAEFNPLLTDIQAEPGMMPNLAGLSMRQVLDVLSPYAMEIEYSGSGQAVGQEPMPGSPVAPGQVVSVFFEGRQ